MGWLNDNLGAIGGTIGLGAGPVGALAGWWGGSQIDDMRAQQRARNEFDPYSGMPSYPGFIAMDPNMAYMGGMAQRNLDQINLNQAPMAKFTAEAMRSGPSRGAALAGRAQDYLATKGREGAKKMAAGEAANARAALSMKGGLGAGGAERLAKQSANRALDLSQAAEDTAARNKMNIGLEDEKNRVAMLGQAPGMQQAAANFGLAKANSALDFAARDRQTYMNDLNAARLYNMNAYNSSMGAWAAGKQAQATQNSGKK